jgi:predicted DNA binding CopG/RHH family protein
MDSEQIAESETKKKRLTSRAMVPVTLRLSTAAVEACRRMAEHDGLSFCAFVRMTLQQRSYSHPAMRIEPW